MSDALKKMPLKSPLSGITVLDFGHTVMGPSCAMVLADLGADVIKIEPSPNGDPTRTLKGFGAGYFGYFNRNKKSLAVDLKTDEGKRVAERLVKKSDVLIENFAPGTMERLGLGYQSVRELNPKIVFASLKGFLPGPYENRLALDEVVQMMAGLAFMTGPSGKPLRAGSSVVDITGGLFAVIGIMAALRERESTGQGQLVESALYEATVFLMGQHLCYSAQVNDPIPPMPERVSAWAIYDVFQCADDQQIFIGITTDSHWRRFCETVGWQELIEDPALTSNNQRIEARPRLLRLVGALAKSRSIDKLSEICERARIPFAPIRRPEDLFEDEHLKATGSLVPTTLPSGVVVPLPKIPVRLGGVAPGLRNDPPSIGAGSREILIDAGLSETEIHELVRKGVVCIEESKKRAS